MGPIIRCPRVQTDTVAHVDGYVSLLQETANSTGTRERRWSFYTPTEAAELALSLQRHSEACRAELAAKGLPEPEPLGERTERLIANVAEVFQQRASAAAPNPGQHIRARQQQRRARRAAERFVLNLLNEHVGQESEEEFPR